VLDFNHDQGQIEISVGDASRNITHFGGRQVIVADISWTWGDTSTANWWTRRARAEEHDLRRVA